MPNAANWICGSRNGNFDRSAVPVGTVSEDVYFRNVLYLSYTHYKPLISNTLFMEYEDVTTRSHILEQCPLTSEELRELLNAYYRVCEWVPIYYLWRPNLPDEGDNFLIELAVAGNAYCVVTNNVRDIKSSELIFPRLHVMTPE